MSACLRISQKSSTFVADYEYWRSVREGEMLEWLKRHAWKACKLQKGFGGSNPPLSAKEDYTKKNTNIKILINKFLFS